MRVYPCHLICAATAIFQIATMAEDLSPMQKHNQVDVVSVDKVGVVTLSMVETRPWGDKGGLLPDLQAKIYAYLDYIESGQLVRNYPQAKDKTVAICLHASFPTTKREDDFIALIKKTYLDPQHIAWTTGVFAQ
jgi:hypothetical protein